MAGRPPVPTERKRLLGNPGKRALPAPVVALAPAVSGDVVEMDDRSSGAELIRNLLGSAAQAWISDPDRLATLVLIRDGWNRRAELLVRIADHGGTYTSHGQSGYRIYRHPDAIELELLEKRLTTWLSLSGLTPVDRSRLGIAEVKVRSRLEALRDRRADRSRAG